jgi:UDPglucose 6-dehydrogenase
MPEFLAEGTAIKNLLNPDRIVIGSNHDPAGRDAFEVLENLCKPFPETKCINPNVASSELSKLFANAMLA